MQTLPAVEPSDYEIGVIIARFQVHQLHEAHKGLIQHVLNNHKKVIIFLGVSVIPNTRTNPLDFATRKAMIQAEYPQVVILPQRDQRSNKKWSENLDEQIRIPFGTANALLYGGRDSFIPHYEGKHKTTELITDTFLSGTEIRKQVSKEILESSDFRAGIIHATYAQWPVTYPTVDVVAYNEKGQILLGRKPNEPKYRFIGGFVDRTDTSWEHAARREFAEETGNCAIEGLEYVASAPINDWRYNKTQSGIMTTLFLGKFAYGSITPSDDISELKWVSIEDFLDNASIDANIMPEHVELMIKLVSTKYDKISIKNK